ncbi:MAG: MFS transporter [Asticcacaulis sp.]
MPASAKQPGFPEFVALIASLMALGALGIDSMLPALSAIGHDLNVADPNHQQWVVQIYFLGLGLGQLVFGVLSDWLGRKRVLLSGVAVYIVFALIAGLTQNFTALLAVRLLQGIAVSTTGVVTRSIVRDLYAGAADGQGDVDQLRRLPAGADRSPHPGAVDPDLRAVAGDFPRHGRPRHPDP